MSKNRIFKNDEELNKALDEVTEVYSKPPTRSEYIFIFVLLMLVPVIGIIAYVYNILWLFYILGGAISLVEFFFLFTGALRCLGSVLLIISFIIGYCVTQSLLIGLLLGSCITASILSIGLEIIMGVFGGQSITGWFGKKIDCNSQYKMLTSPLWLTI